MGETPGGHSVKPRRSALYVPGTNAKAIDKARRLDADVLIFDLEDSVAPEAKAAARAAIVAALRDGGFGRRERVVRINGLATAWGRDDVAALRMAPPDAILLPKTEHHDHLANAADAVAGLAIDLWAMIETPRGVLNVEALFAGPYLPAVAVVGTNDLATDLHARVGPGREPLLPHLARCIAAARGSGLDILDGVFNDFGDAEGLADECAQGRDFGFTGKTLIHPSQIAAANAAFAPSGEERAWAAKVVAAFAAADAQAGVLALEGRMVERLHLAAAQRTLALAAALA